MQSLMAAVPTAPFSTFVTGARVAIRGEEWLIMETGDSPSIRLSAVFGNLDA